MVPHNVPYPLLQYTWYDVYTSKPTAGCDAATCLDTGTVCKPAGSLLHGQNHQPSIAFEGHALWYGVIQQHAADMPVVCWTSKTNRQVACLLPLLRLSIVQLAQPYKLMNQRQEQFLYSMEQLQGSDCV